MTNWLSEFETPEERVRSILEWSANDLPPAFEAVAQMLLQLAEENRQLRQDLNELGDLVDGTFERMERAAQ